MTRKHISMWFSLSDKRDQFLLDAKDYLKNVQKTTHLKNDYIYKDCTKDCMNNLDD